jgi:hypothetical protein
MANKRFITVTAFKLLVSSALEIFSDVAE